MKIEDAISEVIIDPLKKSIIDKDMVATGNLLKSVRFDLKKGLIDYEINIFALDYIVGLNDGIEPKKKPYPEISEIQQWLQKKGLDLNPYAVIDSIIVNGTTWYRQGGSNIVTDAINNESFKKIIELSKDEIQLKIKQQWQLLFKNNR